MEAYSTICPGCGLGCGLYLLRDSEKGEGGERATGKGMSILHRKQSAVNAGKLCKFGNATTSLLQQGASANCGRR